MRHGLRSSCQAISQHLSVLEDAGPDATAQDRDSYAGTLVAPYDPRFRNVVPVDTDVPPVTLPSLREQMVWCRCGAWAASGWTGSVGLDVWWVGGWVGGCVGTPHGPSQKTLGAPTNGLVKAY